MVDTHQAFGAFMFKEQHTFVGRTAQDMEFHTCVGKGLFHNGAFGIVNLDYNGGIFREENFHKVGFTIGYNPFGGYAEAAVHVGEHHFKQGGYQASGRNVVHCQYAVVLHKALHGGKCLFEITGILDSRGIRAYRVERLGECRTAKTQGVG